MSSRIGDSRGVWLVCGILIGLGVSYFWPNEPLRADQADRNDKFGMLTCTATLPVAGLPASEAVFILDFLTGRLQGFYLNPQVGAFSQMFFRDVASDLQLDPKTTAQQMYAFVGGQGQLVGHGGTWGSSLVYVAELTTGSLVAYAFPFAGQANAAGAMPMLPVARAQFRQPVVQ